MTDKEKKGCGIEFPHFGARYPDARCCDGYLSVVDEDGEFKTREEALAYVEQLKKRYLNYE